MTNVLTVVVEYAKFHFEEEEELFNQYSYPESLGHMKKHRWALVFFFFLVVVLTRTVSNNNGTNGCLIHILPLCAKQETFRSASEFSETVQKGQRSECVQNC